MKTRYLIVADPPDRLNPVFDLGVCVSVELIRRGIQVDYLDLYASDVELPSADFLAQLPVRTIYSADPRREPSSGISVPNTLRPSPTTGLSCTGPIHPSTSVSSAMPGTSSPRPTASSRSTGRRPPISFPNTPFTFAIRSTPHRPWSRRARMNSSGRFGPSPARRSANPRTPTAGSASILFRPTKRRVGSAQLLGGVGSGGHRPTVPRRHRDQW